MCMYMYICIYICVFIDSCTCILSNWIDFVFNLYSLYISIHTCIYIYILYIYHIISYHKIMSYYFIFCIILNHIILYYIKYAYITASIDHQLNPKPPLLDASAPQPASLASSQAARQVAASSWHRLPPIVNKCQKHV